jgi:hypothetical protein
MLAVPPLLKPKKSTKLLFEIDALPAELVLKKIQKTAGSNRNCCGTTIDYYTTARERCYSIERTYRKIVLGGGRKIHLPT